MKEKRGYEKQGLGEQGDIEKLRKRNKKMTKESFFFCGQKKKTMKNSNWKGDLTKWKQKVMEKGWKTKKDEIVRRVKYTFFFE